MQVDVETTKRGERSKTRRISSRPPLLPRAYDLHTTTDTPLCSSVRVLSPGGVATGGGGLKDMDPSFTLTCESDYLVLGLQEGEDYSTPIRVVATLISVSIASAWFSGSKITRLRLFFAHWLSGLVMLLGFVVEDMMVTVCWVTLDLEGFIKVVKYIELAAANMLAITNLAICVNLALIVSSHRTMTRVRSTSSPTMIMFFLLTSMVIAAVTVPFWGVTLLLGTSFYLASGDPEVWDFVQVSFFCVEFVVGICMFFIVAWLLLFQMKEIKECWKLHNRIRYYFGLTALSTAVNLGLGICGTINVSQLEPDALLLIWSWIFRYLHVALDTIVLHSVLRDNFMDDRGGHMPASSAVAAGPQSMPGRPRLSTVPEGSVGSSKNAAVAPQV